MKKKIFLDKGHNLHFPNEEVCGQLRSTETKTEKVEEAKQARPDKDASGFFYIFCDICYFLECVSDRQKKTQIDWCYRYI